MCVLEVAIFSSTYLIKMSYNNFFLKFVSQNGSTISTPHPLGWVVRGRRLSLKNFILDHQRVFFDKIIPYLI